MNIPAPIYFSDMDSPLGPLRIAASDVGLRAIEYPQGRHPVPGRGSWIAAPHPLLDETRRQLDAYFAGRRSEFSLPLAAPGSEFQRDVWRALCEIPFGQTRSYAQIAAAVGRPQASRAVGAANGRNPISIVVPCHRVIGAGGTLTGYGGGLPAKQFLLRLERAGWAGMGAGAQ